MLNHFEHKVLAMINKLNNANKFNNNEMAKKYKTKLLNLCNHNQTKFDKVINDFQKNEYIINIFDNNNNYDLDNFSLTNDCINSIESYYSDLAKYIFKTYIWTIIAPIIVSVIASVITTIIMNFFLK